MDWEFNLTGRCVHFTSAHTFAIYAPTMIAIGLCYWCFFRANWFNQPGKTTSSFGFAPAFSVLTSAYTGSTRLAAIYYCWTGRVGWLKARWLEQWHVPQAMDEISAPTPQIVGGKEDHSVSARLTKEIGYGRMEPSKAGRTNLVITLSGSYAIIIHHFSNSYNPSRAGWRTTYPAFQRLSSIPADDYFVFLFL